MKLIRSIVAENKGIEIGGPSPIFRRWYNLPIYDSIGTLDNCDFSKDTTWASHAVTYEFSRKRPVGRVFVGEGSNLQSIPDGDYDFVLSSHNLEHFANPVKALKEWQRVVRPGGHLILVLPHYAKTFDWRRAPTPIEHMFADYDAETSEDDLTHVQETFVAHRLNKRSGTDDDLMKLLLDNPTHRMMHHHVFDEENSKGLLESAGLRVLTTEFMPPFHIIVVGQFEPVGRS